MPITPLFTISQSDSHVIIDVAVPYIRVTHVEVVVEANKIVHVAAAPIYLLVLNFGPYEFCADVQEEEAAATVEPIQGTVRLELEKKRYGEHWENMDLIGKLVQSSNRRRPEPNPRWLREVVDATEVSDYHHTEDETNDELTQQQQTEDSLQGYGFARLFKGVFTDLVRDGLAQEMLEGHHSVGLDVAQRRRKRIEVEDSKFCVDRYLGDLEIQDDYLYQCAMAMRPHWICGDNDNHETLFSSQERLQLHSIPYPLLPDDLPFRNDKLLVGLIDLLFAYVYDHLLTDGDPTVESAWNVSVLSASLSWLDDWLDEDINDDTVLSVIHSSLRRALIYPYLRNLEFAIHCMRQVALIFHGGLRTVIRCLLQLRSIVDRSEMYYLGNKLFVDPFLAWLQANPSSLDLDGLAVAVEQCLSVAERNHLKQSLKLDLIQVEGRLTASSEDGGSDDSSNESLDSDDDDDDDVSSSSASTDSESTADDGLSQDLLDLHLGDSSNESPDSMDLFLLRPNTNDRAAPTDQKSPLIQEM